MNIQNIESNGLKEGIVRAVILDAREYYVLKTGETVFDEPPTDELDYPCIDLIICQPEVPNITMERRITNAKKMRRLFEAANVQPESNGNDYATYFAEKLVGKEIYCLFYRDGKVERGYMTFFTLIARTEDDFDWIKDQFIYAITEGYDFPDQGRVFPYMIHGNSIFSDIAAPEACDHGDFDNNGNGTENEKEKETPV